MDIKDFGVGQKVYILQMNEGRNQKPQISESIAKRIGRKYLTTESDCRYSLEDYFECGLVEKIDFGERRLLFASETELTKYIEKRSLERWLLKLGPSDTKKYTLKQLREVEKILCSEYHESIREG